MGDVRPRSAVIQRIVRKAQRERRHDELERSHGEAEDAAKHRVARRHDRSRLRRFLEDNALTLVAFTLFAITFVAMIGAGFAHDNDERLLHGLAAQTLNEYVVSGSF